MKAVNWGNISIKKFAGIISNELNKNGIDAVLVGGACVSIYSNNRYVSLDLDYITSVSTDEVDKALKKIGFTRSGKFRQYANDKCKFFIEFPPGPVSIGEEGPITEFMKIGTIVLLTATDCVKDRLAAYIHWDDEQSLKQALLVAKAKSVDLKKIQKWAIKENGIEKYNIFKSLLIKSK
jgi:hypothetical protein